MKELRPGPLDGMAEELQYPSHDEHAHSDLFEAEVHEVISGKDKAGARDEERQGDHRYAESVAKTISGVLMARSILCHPLITRPVTHESRHFPLREQNLLETFPASPDSKPTGVWLKQVFHFS